MFRHQSVDSKICYNIQKNLLHTYMKNKFSLAVIPLLQLTK